MCEHAARYNQTLRYGMAAHVISRDTETEAQYELARITEVRAVAGYAGFRDVMPMSELARERTLRRLFGIEPGLAAQLGRHAPTDCRVPASVCRGRRRSIAAPVQPKA